MNSAQDTRCRVGCPIRRSRDQRSLASPPGFSQRAASFIASQCQGIHQMPFISPDPRSRPPGGCPPGKRTPEHRRAQGRAPAAKPAPGRRRTPPGNRLHDSNPAAASRMKTLLSDQPHGLAAPAPRGIPTGQLARARGSSASVIFTNPFHPSINTAAAGSPPAASPRFSERRSQRSRSDRTDRAPVGATAHLQPRPWVPRGAAPCTCRPAKLCFACGGGERDRTDDLLLAKQALSQLSYTPVPETGFDL